MFSKYRYIKFNIYFLVWDICFMLWMVSDYVFSHSSFANASLALFCGISFGMILLTKGKYIKFQSEIVCYGLFIFFSYLNIVLGHSINSQSSRELLITLVYDIIFFIAVSFYIGYCNVQHFKKVIIFCTVITSVIEIIMNYYYTHSIILRGGVINGNVLAVCDAVIICWIVFSKNKNNIFSYGAVAFLLLFCLLCGTRKALLIIVVIAIIYILTNNPNRIMRNITLIVVGLLSSYFALMNIPVLYNLLGIRIETLIALLQGKEGASSEISRMNYINLGLSYFHNNSIWGNGINCFKTIKGSYGTYSHNNYVELLFSVGIVGTVLYYFMHLDILIKGIRGYIKGKNNYIILGISFIIAMLVMDIAMVSYYERSTFMLLSLCMALVETHSNDNINKYCRKRLVMSN